MRRATMASEVGTNSDEQIVLLRQSHGWAVRLSRKLLCGRE